MTDISLTAAAGVLDYELRYVSAVRKRRYRPTKFRSIVRIDNSVPAWATHVETQKITDYAKMVRIGENTGSLPTPSFDKQAGRFNIFEFGLAYRLKDRELERAAKTGINVSATMTTANQTAFEQFCDEVACVGGVMATDENKTGMYGLCTNPDVTPTVLSTKAATGTTWAVATAAEIVYDLNLLLNAVLVNSLEIHEGDTILLPLAQYLIASQRPYSTLSSKTALTTFLEQHPGVRVLPWHWLTLAGGSHNTTRACAFDSKDEAVARFIMAKELTDDQPRRESRGYIIDQTAVFGGVLVEDPGGIAYGDGL